MLHAIVADEDYNKGPFKYFKNPSVALKQSLRANWIDDFEQELIINNGVIWIISSEQLHSRLRSSESIARLKLFLQKYFDDIEVIVYLRNPLSCAVSMLSTHLKTGGTSVDLPHLTNPYWKHLVDHRNTLQAWSNPFPHIIVRRFAKHHLYQSDAVSDFLHVLSIDLPLSVQKSYKPPKSNPSLSIHGMQVLALYNKFFYFSYKTRFIPFVLSRRFALLLAAFVSYLFPEKFSPSSEDIDEYSSLADSDEFVLRNYFPNDYSLW